MDDFPFSSPIPDWCSLREPNTQRGCFSLHFGTVCKHSFGRGMGSDFCKCCKFYDSSYTHSPDVEVDFLMRCQVWNEIRRKIR